MKILICNERFLFRFGLDRVLLLLGSQWKEMGHEVVMMGNRLDPRAVAKCSDRFIPVPEAPDYLQSNEFARDYLKEHWDEWFTKENAPDVVLVAGWPYAGSIRFLRTKCPFVVYHDYGAVPTAGMSEGAVITQNKLRALRREYLPHADKIVAISRFLEESQSRPDAAGKTQTTTVHLGVDHLDFKMWGSDDVPSSDNGVIAEVEKLKADGYKILFMPGRWENGNYKNSAASMEVIRGLRGRGLRVKVLVLSDFEKMGAIPEDVRDGYVCLGFLDDESMRRLMEMSDAGFSPTTWEGFDLPLGEMQYLGKCMYVLDVGAHPEVVADRHFLCSDISEMVEKLGDCLSGHSPFNEQGLKKILAGYREKFTWRQSAARLLEEITPPPKRPRSVFMDVTNACHDTANSGVMRVTRKIAHFIQNSAETVFVLWDGSLGEYVFPYADELKLLGAYGGPDAARVKHTTPDGTPRVRLNDVIDEYSSRPCVHLFTETVSSEVLRRATLFFHSKGIPVSAVFYDAIPVLRPQLCSRAVAENHRKYMLELSRCDLVIPIAAHNEADLVSYWKENGVQAAPVRTVVLAAEMDGVARVCDILPPAGEKVEILFVSTLEHRKNHLRLLRAFVQLIESDPELASHVSLTLVGNRYAGQDEIPQAVEQLCRKHGNIRWLGVVDDIRLRELYANCTFTVYPSEIEGYGMPIIESLWFGKPCLCNKSGSIGELAAAGGCCAVDVLDEGAITAALRRLCADKAYYADLCRAAIRRKITTWREYVDDVAALLDGVTCDRSRDALNEIPVEVIVRIRQHCSAAVARPVIVASNFYPPNFVGGAEVIAHCQARTMQNDRLATCIAFAADTTGKHVPGDVFTEEVDGIPVVRMAVAPACFDCCGINFWNVAVNRIFSDLCALVRPYVVHCHNITGLSLGLFDVAKRSGAKVVVTFHDNWGFCFKNTCLDGNGHRCADIFSCEKCLPMVAAGAVSLPVAVRKAFFRRAFEKVDAYISPSDYQAEAYLAAGFSQRKMHVLWNGIDLKKFSDVRKVKSEKVRVTFVGYFGRHKGIDLLIDAVASLGRADVQINLVGDGEELENYRRQAQEKGILDNVRFWGKIDNSRVTEAYAETDVYCLPSRWPENQPVSITEAMACGIPVIASDYGGSCELVEDGVTGFLFRGGDASDLGEKLRKLVADEELRKRMGEAARRRISSVDFHNQVKRLVSLYDAVEVAVPRPNRPIVAFLGETIPFGADKVTRSDVLPAEWLSKDERQEVSAYVLYGKPWRDVREFEFDGRPVLVPDECLNAALHDGVKAIGYSGWEGLLRSIAKIR